MWRSKARRPLVGWTTAQPRSLAARINLVSPAYPSYCCCFLPLILSQLVFSVISGGLVQKTGYYLPEVVAGNVFIALGSGLTTMFEPSTKAGEWIGYQILVGAGRGMALQVVSQKMGPCALD